MSRRRSLEQHRHNLGEIREIMNSMKTLAYMETRKLAHRLAAQELVVQAQRQVAADLLHFHPDLLPPAAATLPAQSALYLVLGSERGLCGDYNQALLHYIDRELPRTGQGRDALICVGHKLAGLLAEDDRVVAVLEGASVVEEVPMQLSALVEEVHRIRSRRGPLELFALVNGMDGVQRQQLLPTFQQVERRGPASPRQACLPPLLNETADEVFAALVEQHMPALAQWLLYSALMQENHLRVTHLESAIRHLDEEMQGLVRRGNILRQEEIIEEIEVILLSANSIAESRAAMGPAGARGNSGSS